MSSLLFRIAIAQVSSYFYSRPVTMLRSFLFSHSNYKKWCIQCRRKWMHQLPEELSVYIQSPQELHQPGLTKVSAGRYNGGFCLLSGMSQPDRQQAPSTPISGGLCHLQPRLMKRKIPSHVLYHVTHPSHSQTCCSIHKQNFTFTDNSRSYFSYYSSVIRAPFPKW
jgi:hypothetical protein